MLQTEICVYQNPAGRAIDIYVYQQDSMTRECWVAEPLTMKQVKPFEQAMTPTFQLPEFSGAQNSTTLQNLMDQLWNLGVRPRNAKAGDAQIEAMQKHLHDMRHLAFKGAPPA